jgi:hypothetical protein
MDPFMREVFFYYFAGEFRKAMAKFAGNILQLFDPRRERAILSCITMYVLLLMSKKLRKEGPEPWRERYFTVNGAK